MVTGDAAHTKIQNRGNEQQAKRAMDGVARSAVTLMSQTMARFAVTLYAEIGVHYLELARPTTSVTPLAADQ